MKTTPTPTASHAPANRAPASPPPRSAGRLRPPKTLLAACAAALLQFLPAATSEAGFLDMGVYKGGGRPDLVPNFETWFGSQAPRALDFYSESTWTDLQDNSWLLNSWKGKRWAMTFSIAMLPGDGTGSLAAGARGDYNAYWTKIATNLVNAGFGSATLRIGWEMNGGWYKWAANGDKTSWVTYWQQIVTTMRAVTGANFRFDWNPANGYNQFPADQVYPGDAYVDVIGVDVYNQSWITNYTDPVARWNDVYASSRGVQYWLKFAQAHNKPISFPEWGTGPRPDGHGGGDDPYFIQQMYNVIATANVAYHNYWDYCAADYCGILSDNSKPNAGAKFKELFGQTFKTGKYSARQFETEVLPVAATSGATHQALSDNQFSYAQGTLLNATAAGQSVTYLVSNVPTGVYNVKVRVRKTGGEGIWQLKVGRADNFAGTAVNVGAAQDEYGGSTWTYPELDLGNMNITAGADYWFQFAVTGKNASSTGYAVAFDYLKLTYLPATLANGTVYRVSPQCATAGGLDVAGVSTADGANVQIWTYYGGTNQKWKAFDVGNGYWEFEPQHAIGKRLDVAGAGAADGTNVQQLTGSGSASQRWKLIDNGDGTVGVEPQCAPGKRLDVNGGNSASGTNVQIWTSNTSNAQRWKFLTP